MNRCYNGYCLGSRVAVTMGRERVQNLLEPR